MIKLQQLLVNNKAIWIYIMEQYTCACMHVLYQNSLRMYTSCTYMKKTSILRQIINMVHIPSGEISISIKTCDTINTGLQFSLIQYCYYCNFMKTQFSFFSRVLQKNIIAWAVDLQNLLHLCIYIYM